MAQVEPEENKGDAEPANEIKEGGESDVMHEGGDAKVEDAEAAVENEEENKWSKVEKDEWGCPAEPTGDAETD